MNRPAIGQDASRREFLRCAARYGSLSVLVGVSAWMVRQNRACINDGICGRCPVFGECRLPPAVEAQRISGGV